MKTLHPGDEVNCNNNDSHFFSHVLNFTCVRSYFITQFNS